MNETISKREEILEELVSLRKALSDSWHLQEESFTAFHDRTLPPKNVLESHIAVLTEEANRIRRLLDLAERFPKYVADEPIITTAPSKQGILRLFRSRTPVQTIIAPEDFTQQANFQTMRLRQMLEDVAKTIVFRRGFLEQASLLVKTSVVMADEVMGGSLPSYDRLRMTAEWLASAIDANATNAPLWQRRFETLLSAFKPQSDAEVVDSDFEEAIDTSVRANA